MKKITLSLLPCFIAGFISCISCSKEPAPQPDPDVPGNGNPPPGADLRITKDDLLAHYFITELSSGKLRVDYFFMEGNTLKGLRDGLDMRRGLESITLSNDTLRYIVSEANIYTYVLRKDASGKITIIHSVTSTEGVTAHVELQPVAKATSFVSTGNEHIFRYTTSQGDPVYLYFAFIGAGNVWRHDGVNGASDYMEYYLLNERLGWKSNDERTFGVAVSSWKGNDNIGMLIQSAVPDLGEGIHAAIDY